MFKKFLIILAGLISFNCISYSQTIFNGASQGAFNGSRLQVNTTNIYNSGEFPFLNVFKAARFWATVVGSASVNRALADSNGYPTSIESGGWATNYYIPTQVERAGNYRVRWDGNGTVVTGGTPVSGSLTSTTGTGEYVFTPASGNPIFQITAITGPPITNIRICHVDDCAALDAGQVFQSKYLGLMRSFGYVRSLGWPDANVSTVVKWADRMPTTYWSYADNAYPTQYLATATLSGSIYSATISGFSLVDKARAIVKFDTNQTINGVTVTITNGSPTIGWTAHGFLAGDRVGFTAGTNGGNALPAPFMQIAYYVSATNLATDSFEVSLISGGSSISATSAGNGTFSGVAMAYLNVSGTGAKPILWFDGRPRYGNTLQFGTYKPVFAGRWSGAVYDALLDGWIVQNDQDGDAGIFSGPPPEILIRLANDIGAHPWFIAPFLACDPISDWFSGLSTYAQSNLSPGLKLIIEGPNELWNGAFRQTKYANLKEALHLSVGGTPYNADFGYPNWYGRIMAGSAGATIYGIGGAISAAYNNDRTKYKVIIGYQGAGGQPTERTNSTHLVSETGNSAIAAKLWATDIAVANYWNAGLYRTATETTLANAYNGGDLTALDTYVASSNNLTQSGENFPIGYVKTLLAPFQSFAAGITNQWGDILGLRFYEGGYSPDYVAGDEFGGPAAVIYAFRKASKSHPDLKKYEKLNAANMMNLGTNVQGPSWLSLSGGNDGSANPWTIYEPNIYASPIPSRWQAILDLQW